MKLAKQFEDSFGSWLSTADISASISWRRITKCGEALTRICSKWNRLVALAACSTLSLKKQKSTETKHVRYGKGSTGGYRDPPLLVWGQPFKSFEC